MMMKPAITRLKTAVELLGISRATLYRRVQDGEFDLIKRGHLTYVPTEQIERYLDPARAQ
ncbi:helix-turn-helix domain-containing protein [Breoghania sp.]|uniref:helix-turn-helix transcriptional regulator n=1 Tax=Breoghania sp. TaxID=2065378 RepID=UPI002AA69E68|nr:helix-turn-helix domain-containing protein [Breoghania sp.]